MKTDASLRRPWTVIRGLLLIVLVARSAQSQVIDIWPGVAPGSEHWTHKEAVATDTPLGTVVWNVVTPTLTPYLPDRTKATRTGIIVAPGGAFVALAIDQAHDIARWLQEKGIAAFVLKYRIPEKRGDGIPAGINQDESGKYGIADGIQALKVVRAGAASWGLSADRIGFLGLSAGAMVASGALLQQTVDARPNFAGLLYGGPFGVMPPIPSRLPPIFMAWAQDDNVALPLIVRFHSALAAAGHKPEVHIFRTGGHGFAIKPQGTSSDHWIDALYNWLAAQGLTRR